MQLIILAAGMATRLEGVSTARPKALLDIHGQPLLHHQIDVIASAFDLERTVVVVGYRMEVVREVGGAQLTYVENPDFASTNTATSLAMALEAHPVDTLLLNGDVYLDGTAAAAVRDHRTAALCDFRETLTAEDVQVVVGEDDSIERIGKDIGGVGEAVGLYRLTEADAHAYLAEYRPTDDGQRYYEDVFNRLLADGRLTMTAAPLGSAAAMEVDDGNDLDRLRRLLTR